MGQFISRTVIYGVLFIALCYGLQFMADKGLRKSESNDYKNWTLILDGDIDADILVTGSSRAMRMIDPAIIDAITGVSSYNLGMEGARLKSQLTRWDAYLKSNKSPELIIQTVDLMSMGHAETVFKKQQFLPFLSEPTIYENLKEVDNRLFLDRYFPLYKYHGYISEFKEGIGLFLGRPSAYQYTEYKGYESKDKKFNNEFQQMKDNMTGNVLLHPEGLIEEGFEILYRMINDCEKRDIELVLAFTPQYFGLTELQTQADYLLVEFEKLGNIPNVHFINYVHHDICKDKTYFYNAMHLNKKGADIFTEMLVNDLYDRGILVR